LLEAKRLSIQQKRTARHDAAAGEKIMISRRTALGLLGTSAFAASTGRAFALDYPTRPVKFVVGYPAGGATDIFARLIGQRLSERLHQQFVVENKPGAGNNIGTAQVVNADPDGYPVLLSIPRMRSTPRSMQNFRSISCATSRRSRALRGCRT
jgi:tripartite-type tricarboxylate transporter receptor subunit TctC